MCVLTHNIFLNSKIMNWYIVKAIFSDTSIIWTHDRSHQLHGNILVSSFRCPEAHALHIIIQSAIDLHSTAAIAFVLFNKFVSFLFKLLVLNYTTITKLESICVIFGTQNLKFKIVFSNLNSKP